MARENFGISFKESANVQASTDFLSAWALDQSTVWILTRPKNIIFDLGQRLMCLTSGSYFVYIHHKHWLVYLINFPCLICADTSSRW